MAGLMDRIEVILDRSVTDIYNHTTSIVHDDIYNLNREFYEGYQWIAAIDSITCLACASLDNQIFDRLPNQEGGGTQAPEQPLHPNCVLGDSVVISPDMQKLTKSHYSGDIFKLFTADGRSLSITPNHIMLTARGWVRAKFLVKGDKIISYRGWDKITSPFSRGNPADNYGIATIENLFTAFSENIPMFASGMKSASVDFKSDIVENTKIDIINIDSLLRYKSNPDICKMFFNFPFINAMICNETILSTQSSLALLLMCISLASDGIMSIDSVTDIFSRRSSAHHKLISFLVSSNYDARLFKSASNKESGSPVIFSNLCNTFSEFIFFDEITNIERSNFSGHVYDASALSTLYIANGFLSSNCRCVMVPVLQGDREGSQAGPNYKDWFERQSRDTQLDILGPSRFKAFLDGKEITQFVNDKDQIITLDDLGIDRIRRKELVDAEAEKKEETTEIKTVQGTDEHQNIMLQTNETKETESSNMISATPLTAEEKKDYAKYIHDSLNEFKISEKAVEQYAEQINSVMERMPPEIQRLLYETRPQFINEEKFPEQFSPGDPPYINLHKNTVISQTQPNIKTWFHEMAHAIDWRSGQAIKGISAGWADAVSAKLLGSLKSEYDAFLDGFGKSGVLELFSKKGAVNPLWGFNNYGASDIIGILSKNKYVGELYHSKPSYWKDENAAMEAFSHLTTQYAWDGGMRRYFPKTAAMFDLWLKTGKI